MASAGRIMILPKGVYNKNTTYEMLDSVSYGGKGWVCKKTCTGVTPEEGEYWATLIDISLEIEAINESLGKKLDKIGGTLTGDIFVNKGNGAGNVSVLSPTRQVTLNAQTEAQGNRAGIWDNTNNKWMIYSDASGNVFVNGANLNSDLANYLPLTANVNLRGNLGVELTTNEITGFLAKNPKGQVMFMVDGNGNKGLYDVTNQSWIIKADASGNSDLALLSGSDSVNYANMSAMVLGIHNSLKDEQSVCKNYTYDGNTALVIGNRYTSVRGRYLVMPRHEVDVHTYQVTGSTTYNYRRIVNTYDLADYAKIQRGSGTVTIVSPTTTPVATEIRFEKPFSSVPTVMLDSQHRHLISAYDVTTTSFTVSGINTELSQIDGTFTWVAFG